jgi:hypothetical protein
MELRTVTSEDGVKWYRSEDIIELLRVTGRDYLEHIPAHAEAGEFMEAMLDRHADFILCQVAEWLEGAHD